MGVPLRRTPDSLVPWTSSVQGGRPSTRPLDPDLKGRGFGVERRSRKPDKTLSLWCHDRSPTVSLPTNGRNPPLISTGTSDPTGGSCPYSGHTFPRRAPTLTPTHTPPPEECSVPRPGPRSISTYKDRWGSRPSAVSRLYPPNYRFSHTHRDGVGDPDRTSTVLLHDLGKGRNHRDVDGTDVPE